MLRTKVVALAMGLAISALGVASATPARAATLLDWDIEFVGKSPDLVRSAINLGGFNNWTKWVYKVTANSNTGCCPGEFTHLGVGLPSLPHITGTAFIAGGIEDSGGVSDSATTDVSGAYDILFRTSGGPIGAMGQHMEWNNLGDRLILAGEFDFFYFSTPDSVITTVALGLKQDSTRAFGTIEGPGALVPEPGTLALLGLALASIVLTGSRRS